MILHSSIKSTKSIINFKKILMFLLILLIEHPGDAPNAQESNYSSLMCNVRNSKDYFVGRKDFLKNMYNQLFGKQSTEILFISGSAGSGKTQVIRKFAELHQNKYAIIWWFDISKNIDDQYYGFARKWNKLISKQIKDSAEQDFLKIPLDSDDVDKLQEEIYDRLKTTNFNWLIIFDKVENSVIPLNELPKHNDNGYGHIIMSTKNDIQLPNALHLNKLNREESIALLLKITGETDPQKADILADTLKDYPLAISKAGSYIASHSAINMEDYSQLFLTKKQELWKAEQEFNSKKNDFNSYKNTLHTTFSKAIDEIKHESPLAYELLKLSSFLSEKNIPEEFLNEYFKANYNKKSADIDFKNALSTLKRHSLLIRNYNVKNLNNEASKQEATNLFSIHEIVQIIIQESLTLDEKQHYLNQATMIMNKILPKNIYQLTDMLNQLRYLISHSFTLIKNANELGMHNNEVIGLNLRMLEYNLAGIRNDKEAEKLIIQIKELEQKTKKVNEINKIRFAVMKSAFLAWVRSDLPNSLKEAIYALEIINKFERNAYLKERLMIYNRLSRLYNALGENSQAHKYSKLSGEVINNNSNLHGEFYGYKRDFYKILVKIHLDTGNLNKALEISEFNLTKSETSCKQKIQDIKLSISDISAYLTNIDILIRLKDYSKARVKLNKLIELTDQSLPGVHLYRSNIIFFSSYVNAMLGLNLKQSINDLIKAQNTYKSLIDGNTYYKNRHIFMSYRFLGEIYEKDKNYEKASEGYKTALSILNNIYTQKGNSITDDLSDIYYKLTITNLRSNKTLESLEYYQIHQRLFGIDHERSVKLTKEFVSSNVDLGI